jgi:PAS domain S-box-containing protein
MTDVPLNLPLPMPRAERVSLFVARSAAVAATLIGGFILVYWRVDHPQLQALMESVSTMRPDAALSVVIGGVALLAFTWRRTRSLGRVLAIPVIALAVLALGYDALGWQYGLNQAFIGILAPVRELPETRETARMALGIGLSLLLYGLALASAGRGPAMSWLSQVFCIALLVQVLIVLTGYAYGITSVYYPFPFSALSVDGAASALLLGVGLLAATPDRGLSGAIVERSPAGEMLRRMLPGILILPLLTGWLAHLAELNGLYDSAAAFAIFAVACVVVLAAFAWTTMTDVRHADADRNEALYELRRQREWLQITLGSIGDGVIATDAEGKVLLLNRVAEELTGWSEAEAKGRPITDIFRTIDEGTRKPLPNPALLALDQNEVSRLGDNGLLLTREDRELPIEDSGSPILSADGSVTGAVLIFRDVTETRRAAQRQTMLVGELNHRVKNALAIVQSLVQASLRQADSAPAMAMAETLGQRLRALHRAHDLLLESQWSGASLKSMVERELEPYMREDGPEISAKGPDVLLPPSCTSILAMTLHELATNAVKYGALSQSDGKLDVTWKMSRAKRLRFTWRERGSTPPQKGASGFGTQLIERGIKHNLGGETKLDFRPEGLFVELDVPLEQDFSPRQSASRVEQKEAV